MAASTIDRSLAANYYNLVAEIQQRYRDLALNHASLVSERDRLREIIEGLLGVYGKYVDEAEVARWRAMATVGAVPR